MAFLISVSVILTSPNLVLLSADTLRADRLGAYGCERNISPNLDRLAARSLVFENAVCEVPITNPSFGSMFTSTFPRMTGTTRNGLRMPEHVPTLAEILKNAGYHTFCVQSNWTLKHKLSGLDRGFDVYDDEFHTRRWGIFKAERYADEVTDRALALLERRDTSKPFFCWVHYSDPHAPYRFHRQFNPSGKARWRLDRVEETRARYDSEVAFMDYHMGRFLERLPTENTVVVFIADHGESLYEHDYLGHGRRIYQHEVHIPFFICAHHLPAGRSSVPARGIDVAPTVLGLAGVPTPSGMLGVDLLRETVAPGRIRVIETYGGAVPHVPGAKAVMAGRPPMRQGVLWNDWKLILGGPKIELYHLGDDPLELRNLAEEHPERVEELRKLIEAWDKATPRNKAAEAELTQDDLDALKAGGYL